MNNNLLKLQRMLMKEAKRLDNNEYMKENGKEEIARGNSLSQTVNTYLKSVNVGIRVIEIAEKYNIQQNELAKQIGINNEK